MLETFYNALHANDDILFYNEYFDKVTYILLIKDILAVDLDKINLHSDNNCDEDDPDTIIHVIHLAGVVNLENAKHFIRRTNAKILAS